MSSFQLGLGSYSQQEQKTILGEGEKRILANSLPFSWFVVAVMVGICEQLPSPVGTLMYLWAVQMSLSVAFLSQFCQCSFLALNMVFSSLFLEVLLAL